MTESLRIRVVQPGIWMLTPLEHAKTQLALCAFSAGLSHGKHARRYATNGDVGRFVGLPSELAAEYSPIEFQSFGDAASLLARLRDARPFPHMSTWEHSAITFLIRCSRIGSHEIVRHRNTAYTQQSTRYVEEKRLVELVKPPDYPDSVIGEYQTDGNSIVRVPTFVQPGEPLAMPAIDPAAEAWLLGDAMALLRYRKARASGVKRESARYGFPHSLRVFMTITANFRQLRYFQAIRSDSHAAPELQLLGRGMHGLLESIDPVLVQGDPEPPH